MSTVSVYKYKNWKTSCKVSSRHNKLKGAFGSFNVNYCVIVKKYREDLQVFSRLALSFESHLFYLEPFAAFHGMALLVKLNVK
jgi:hypothetical protein